MDDTETNWVNRSDARYDGRDDEAIALGAFEGLRVSEYSENSQDAESQHTKALEALEALEALGEMRIHCPETAFDELVRTLSALDENEPGSVEKAAELAAEYDRCIGDLSAFQRAMVRVAASTAGPETRRLAARAGFRSIARAVLRIRDKKKRETRTLKLDPESKSKSNLSKLSKLSKLSRLSRVKLNQKHKSKSKPSQRDTWTMRRE